MRDSLLASFGVSAPICPIVAIENDPTNGWGQFGLLGLLLFASSGIIKKFMDRSLDQQERLVTSTIEQQKAQTTVLVGIGEEIRQTRLATATLDARITKHMDDDAAQAKIFLEELRAIRRAGDQKP